MPRRHHLLVLALVGIVACTKSRPGADGRPEKPVAPVAVQLTALPVGNDRYDVKLTAIPAADTPEVALAVQLPTDASLLGGQLSTRFGRTHAGSGRSLSLRIQLASGDLVGSAVVRTWDGQARSRAEVLSIGPRPTAAQATFQRVRLPTGDEVAEVRP